MMKPSTGMWLMATGLGIAFAAYVYEHNRAPIPCPSGTVTRDVPNSYARFGFNRFCDPPGLMS